MTRVQDHLSKQGFDRSTYMLEKKKWWERMDSFHFFSFSFYLKSNSTIFICWIHFFSNISIRYIHYHVNQISFSSFSHLLLIFFSSFSHLFLIFFSSFYRFLILENSTTRYPHTCLRILDSGYKLNKWY